MNRIKRLSLFCYFLVQFINWVVSSSAFATVFEFDSDGTATVYEAQDYLAPIRHQKFNRKPSLFHSSEHFTKKFDEYVVKAAEKYGIDQNLIHAVIKAESAYNPDAISTRGAGGLMQLMPETAKQYGVKDIFSPADNINGGTKYLRFLIDKYSGDISLVIAAYNAGEGAVDKYDGMPPYRETREYVERVSFFLSGGFE